MHTLLPVIAAAFIAAGNAFAQETVPISGYEVFPGMESGDTTVGVTFAGWTTADAAVWHSPSEQTGGFWAAGVTRVGSSGIGGRVVLVAGRWILQTPGGTPFVGEAACSVTAQNCFVNWPGALEEDIGCGPGVARFHVDMAIGTQDAPVGGAFDGCLDDTHFATVFPPRVWGAFTLSVTPPGGASNRKPTQPAASLSY